MTQRACSIDDLCTDTGAGTAATGAATASDCTAATKSIALITDKTSFFNLTSPDFRGSIPISSRAAPRPNVRDTRRTRYSSLKATCKVHMRRRGFAPAATRSRASGRKRVDRGIIGDVALGRPAPQARLVRLNSLISAAVIPTDPPRSSASKPFATRSGSWRAAA